MNSITTSVLPLADLIENFSILGDWEERYQYLIDLGRLLPPMDEALKNDQTLVNGCVSKVWIFSQKATDGRFHFVADSDGNITKGLIYVVLSAYEGKTAAEIKEVAIQDNFKKLGLDEHLSPNRRNGFFAMVERIQKTASL